MSVVAGSAIGAVIATEISWRRTDKKVRKLIERLLRDERIREDVKRVAREFVAAIMDELRERAPEVRAMFMMRVSGAELPKELELAGAEARN